MKRVLQDFVRALTSPESYRDFMNYKKRYLLLYAFVLVFVIDIVTFSIPAAQIMSLGGYEAIVEEGVPEFTLNASDGLLLEEPIEMDEYGFYIKADPNVVQEDITDIDGQYGSYDCVVVADKEKFYIYVNGMDEMIVRYDEMKDISLTKADVMNGIPLMYVASVWVCVIMLLMDYLYYFVTAVVISWFAGIFAMFMKVRINNIQLLKMAVYAGTLSYVLNLVQTIAGIQVPNYNIFSYIITLGYMFFAIKEYKESGYEELPSESIGGREDKF